jgi:hypothetical protein
MFHIITAFTKNYQPYIDISSPILDKYCTKHNYEKHIYEIPDNYSRPVSWYKVEQLLNHINTNSGFSLWLDTDTIIINSDFKLDSIVSENKFIYISKDMNNINAGVMMIKNNTYSYEFFQKVWGSTQFLNHIWWEQAAMIDLIDKNYMNINNHIKYIPQNIFNSYAYEYYGYPNHDGQVCKDSFILHCPGLPNNTRLQLLKYYKEYYQL